MREATVWGVAPADPLHIGVDGCVLITLDDVCYVLNREAAIRYATAILKIATGG